MDKPQPSSAGNQTNKGAWAGKAHLFAHPGAGVLKDGLVAGLAFVLWLITVALGLWEVYVLRQLYYLIYARLAPQFGGGDYESADAIGYCLLPILAFGFIAFAIGSGEWHRLNLGRPRSWKVFAITIAIQLAILLIYEII